MHRHVRFFIVMSQIFDVNYISSLKLKNRKNVADQLDRTKSMLIKRTRKQRYVESHEIFSKQRAVMCDNTLIPLRKGDRSMLKET